MKKKRRFLAVILSLVLILSMLPVGVFAAADNTLGGTLKITGDARVGGKLKADLSKVTPAGIKEKDLDFRWMKKPEKKAAKDSGESKPFGTEASLQVTKEMEGLSVILEISPKKDSGIAGEKLTAEAVKIEGAAEGTATLEKPIIPQPEEETVAEEPTEEPIGETPIEEPVPEEGIDEPQEPMQEVMEAPVITTEALPSVGWEADYRVQLEAVSEGTVIWSLKEGSVLPEGLTLSPEGILEGKTTAKAGDYAVVIAAANEGGSTEKEFTLTVEEKAVYSMSAEPETIDFGEIEEGYKEVKGQRITLTNTGNRNMVFQEMNSTDFEVESTEGDLTVDSKLHLTIVPKDGLKKGTYQEDLVFITEEGAKATVAVRVKIVEEVVPVYEIAVSPAEYDFGVEESGYPKAPKAAEFTITNTGNQEVTLVQPEAKDYRISKVTAKKLAPKEKATFTVQPKKELLIGDYHEVIAIVTEDVADASVEVFFQVTGPKLLAVISPEAVTGLPNAVEKSAKAFGLPESVKIKTASGEMKAAVNWDVKGCVYDPASVEAQNFTVDGKITLPKDVENPDAVSLKTQIQVGVKAYVPRIPDTSELKINDLSSKTTYKTYTDYRFSATGAGNNSSPRKGDVRYIPYAWKLDQNSYRNFADTNYSAVLKATEAGTRTLSVSFRRDVYNGKEWAADGSMAYKEMNLKFIKGTVKMEPNDTTKKKAVETGDTTDFTGWTVLLAAAAVVIGGAVILLIRRRRYRR